MRLRVSKDSSGKIVVTDGKRRRPLHSHYADLDVPNILLDFYDTLVAGGISGSTAWDNITGKPATFTPSGHAHADYVGTADARLSDARTPTAHGHAATDVTGTAIVEGDARLTDARTPTAHNHEGVYAPTHGHPYASDNHNHDIAYAASGHNHDGSYATPHAHPYASDSHNHDLAYAAAGHNHEGVYAPVHAHPYLTDAPSDGVQYARKDGLWSSLQVNVEQVAQLPETAVVGRMLQVVATGALYIGVP